MAEKEQMQPFWYQGYLIDPNEELPFSPEQLEAENAWNDMWEEMTEEEQEAYMKEEFGTMIGIKIYRRFWNTFATRATAE